MEIRPQRGEGLGREALPDKTQQAKALQWRAWGTTHEQSYRGRNTESAPKPTLKVFSGEEEG